MIAEFLTRAFLNHQGTKTRSTEISVIPAKAGIHEMLEWIPAFAGMTILKKKASCLRVFVLVLCAIFSTAAHAYDMDGQPHAALALYDAPAHDVSKPLPYADPNAKKGGTLRMGAIGGFDSLNPFILKGNSAPSIGLTFETLMEQSADEPFSVYARLADSVAVFKDKVVFHIDPRARFSDGSRVTAQDVVFTFNALRTKGAPFYRGYYGAVKDARAEGERVTFTVDVTQSRELPLILGQLPVLPAAYFKDKPFENTTLTPITGSGPYKLVKVDAGRGLTYERRKDWWGAALPQMRGRYNFDKITVDMYRDTTVAIEAFLADRYDIRQENVAKVWAKAYAGPAVDDGRIKKVEIQNGLPAGMQCFAMNTRRAVFADRAVRTALQYAFDFEWSNKMLAHGAYKRDYSYFTNSDMAATGLPQGAERKLLESFRDGLPPEVFTTPYIVPKTDGSGNARENLKQAAAMLDFAGYTLGPDGVRVNKKTGVRLSFEILHNQPEFERWVLPFIRNLKKIGVEATFRSIDDSQYINRLQQFDFDMTVGGFGQSLSPGNEQADYWGAKKADEMGSRNIMGIKDPVVDALVAQVVAAKTRGDLTVAVRALDRVLLWGQYAIPQWYINTWRVAYWDRFGRPAHPAPYDLGITDTWWVKN